MEALGYRFQRRGQRTDEMIEVLRRCWTGKPPPFEGEEIAVPEKLVFEPRPSQPSGPPILVGGMSRVALRRAAIRGDGWLAFQREELDTRQLADSLKTLEDLLGDSVADRARHRRVVRHSSPPRGPVPGPLATTRARPGRPLSRRSTPGVRVLRSKSTSSSTIDARVQGFSPATRPPQSSLTITCFTTV
jgi:alkanesulfonate monooxygenase SsuD/methylene tetrahydromethanopterin reductase-like flavin-dependent oxidoreductase (luciferase family)